MICDWDGREVAVLPTKYEDTVLLLCDECRQAVEQERQRNAFRAIIGAVPTEQ